MKYFQSLTNDNNVKFVKEFKAKWGDDSVIGDVTQAAYLGPWLWKAAVEKAAASNHKVVAASPASADHAPEGYVKCMRIITCGRSSVVNGRRMVRRRSCTSRTDERIRSRKVINNQEVPSGRVWALGATGQVAVEFKGAVTAMTGSTVLFWSCTWRYTFAELARFRDAGFAD